LIDLDEEFHSLIILESGNGKLYEVWSTLKAVNMMIFVSTYSLDLFNSGRQGPAHQKIVEIIKRKSEDDIQTIISEHYNDSIDIFELMDRVEEE
ncbi:MAG TPA: FCD domain-containing protein, partial [Cerasibacillus sp.]|uniref:FCD domain-containing protein n=1 Tax=Cerasibacillus sp. TaxID=2498711 RepID=UPI002F40C9DB